MNARTALLAALLVAMGPALRAQDEVWELCQQALVQPSLDATAALAHCEALFASPGTSEAGATCLADLYRRSSLDPVLKEEAKARLEERAGGSPNDPWLQLRLGRINWGSPNGADEDAFELAVTLFERSGERRGEAEARLALAYWLLNPPNGEANSTFDVRAEELIDQAEEIGLTLNDPVVLASVKSRRAELLVKRGSNLRQAYHLLLDAEEIFFTHNENYAERRIVLRLLGKLASELGLSAEAAGFTNRRLQLTCENQKLVDIAGAALSVAVTDAELQEGPEWRERSEERALFALEAAKASNNIQAQLDALRLLGDLALGAGDAEKGERYLNDCNALAAREEVAPWQTWPSQLSYAAFLVHHDPDRASAMIERALESSSNPGDWQSILLGSAASFEVTWNTDEPPEAYRRSLLMLDLVDDLVDFQTLHTARSQILSVWTPVYSNLAGRLLRQVEAKGGDPMERNSGQNLLEEAFQVMERRRSRVLLERLRDSQHPPPAGPLVERLGELIEQRMQLNRRRLTLEDVEFEQLGLLDESHDLDLKIRDLRRQIVQESPGEARLSPDLLASLDEVTRTLAPNEAMLYYQVAKKVDLAGRFTGGSWVLAITAKRVTVHLLDSENLFSPGMANSMRWHESDGIGDPSTAFHETLSQVLVELPTTVDHLIVLGDGELHRLPFGLLQPSATGAPLMESHSISYAPSATLWVESRSKPPLEGAVPLIALGDPATLNQSNPREATEQRGWSLDADLQALRCARKEVRRARHWLGEGAVALTREAASEAELKLRVQGNAAVVHLAAHAVVDEAFPARSAVLLAPGSAQEDGWLQPEEIEKLALEGALVVLSTCRSAGGKLLLSEGPQSLAQPFLLAGARAVLATLREIDDCRTLALIDAFYRHLATGKSVASALASAQRDRRAAGDPASEWGAFLILGDGGHVPFPNGRKALRSTRPTIVGLAVVLLLTLLWIARKRSIQKRLD